MNVDKALAWADGKPPCNSVLHSQCDIRAFHALAAEVRRLREFIRDVADDVAPSFDDARLDYVDVQITRAVWEQLKLERNWEQLKRERTKRGGE